MWGQTRDAELSKIDMYLCNTINNFNIFRCTFLASFLWILFWMSKAFTGQCPLLHHHLNVQFLKILLTSSHTLKGLISYVVSFWRICWWWVSVWEVLLSTSGTQNILCIQQLGTTVSVPEKPEKRNGERDYLQRSQPRLFNRWVHTRVSVFLNNPVVFFPPSVKVSCLELPAIQIP